MNKKMISLAIICMFLLTGFMVGTATGKRDTNTQTTNNPMEDLKVELMTKTNWGNPIGVGVAVYNNGDEVVTGPVDINLTISRGFFIFRTTYEENTYTVLSEGQTLNPGSWVYTGDWYPTPMYTFGIFTMKYSLVDYEDENPDNNFDSHKYFMFHYRMYWLFGNKDFD